MLGKYAIERIQQVKKHKLSIEFIYWFDAEWTKVIETFDKYKERKRR